MITKILDGRAEAEKLLSELKSKIQQKQIRPKLLIIQVDDDPASTQYVNIKKKRGEEIGAEVFVERLQSDSVTPLKELVHDTIVRYQNDVNGVMIQLPLPKTSNTEDILSLIPAHLDVDGLRLESSKFSTAVAESVVAFLKLLPDATKSKILILGMSPYVGKSIHQLLMTENYANIVTADINTSNVPELLQEADIVISCIGKPYMYNAKQMRQGAVLIDVGTSKNIEGKIVGDFDTASATGYLSAYTPVPGGVGPMTVASLLKHLVENTAN